MSENQSLSQPQSQAIDAIKAQLLEEAPKAEVKAWTVTPVPETEIKGGLALVRVELGFPQDEGTYRAQLRETRVYLVSSRGRVEAWKASAAFRKAA